MPRNARNTSGGSQPTQKRLKGVTLPLLNEGHPFSLVTVNGKPAVSFGTGGASTVLYLNKFVREAVASDDVVESCHLPLPPDLAYEENVATIGGVGKTIRWLVVIPRRKNNLPATLFVANIYDKSQFEDFLKSLEPFAFRKYGYESTSTCGFAAYVDVPDNTKAGIVASKLHNHGYGAILHTTECQGKLGIERFDRSEHMWWNQNPKTAGPLRDTHRWKYPWCNWKYLPFTWHLLALNVDLPTSSCQGLPLPLRNYVLQLRKVRAKQELQILRDEGLENHEIESFLSNEIAIATAQTVPQCVTARLTTEQNRQLLCATYYILVAPSNNKIVELSYIVQYAYCLHGYNGREIGGYRQNAENLGHGEYIRKFKNKEQYKVDNMVASVVNKVMQSDGTFRGSGYKGARGKHGHKSFKKYKPRPRLSRSITLETEMRTGIVNCFAEYQSGTSNPTASTST